MVTNKAVLSNAIFALSFFLRVLLIFNHHDRNKAKGVLLGAHLAKYRPDSTLARVLLGFNPYAPLAFGHFAAISQKDFGGRGIYTSSMQNLSGRF